MDVGPVRLFGAYETPKGSRSRVFWKDGRLFVVRSRTDVTALEVPVRPVEVAKSSAGKRTWEATTVDGETVSITEEGCRGCGFTLMAIPARSIPDRVPA
jgi:hypothetical protein